MLSNLKGFFVKFWPILVIFLATFLFFWKVFFLRQVPIPGDFIVGTYFPWLDYKWGYEVGVPVKNPLISDVVSIVYPLRSYAVDILKQGQFPLWNPFMFAGYPLLANYQVAVFSPTTIFYFLLPKIWAWTGQVMIQPFLAAVFTYLLLRNFELGKKESLFGGLFYAFSAFSILWLEWATHSLVAAFIPLIIYLFDKFISTIKFRWGVLLSVAVCMQLFSGYPQLVVFTLISLVVFAAFRAERLTRVKIIYSLFFILLGTLLSSIHTLPAIELIMNSQRRFEFLEPGLIYLPWKNLITFLAPDYFGNPATGNYFGIGNYAINAGYSGVVVLILSIIGSLVFWKNKVVKYFVFLTIFALLASLPTPLAKAIFYSPLPGISATSNTRILVLANLSLAVLASFGLSALFKKERINKLKIILSFFAPLATLVGTFIVTYIFWKSLSPDLLAINRLDVSMRNLILPIAFALGASALILLRQKFHSLSSLLVLFLCFLALVELFRYGWKYTPFSPPNLVFPDTPALSYLKKEAEPYRISPGNVTPMNMWIPYGLESISGYDAVYPVWWAKLFSVISSNNPESSPAGRYAPFDQQYANNWFDLLNNKYLFVLKSDKFSKDSVEDVYLNRVLATSKFGEVFQDRSVVILKNHNVLPRAFVVGDWESLSDEETLKTLIDSKFPLGKKIIINGTTNLKKSGDVKSKVSYNFYSSGKSIIKVNTNKDGFLFISDAWYPGWKAKIDNENVQIYRADYAFRAVPITAGEHKVELIYYPEIFKIGKGLSLLALILLIMLTFKK